MLNRLCYPDCTMKATFSTPLTTHTKPPRLIKQPAYWALGLADGVLYAKAFQDHWDANFYKEACLKNSDCKRVAVTTRKATWATIVKLLSWEYSQVVFTIGN